MANHKSAEKRARQSIRKQAVNRQRKSRVKTAENRLLKAIASKNVSEAANSLKEFMTEVMRAAKTNVVSKLAASRKMSRLSSQVSKMQK